MKKWNKDKKPSKNQPTLASFIVKSSQNVVREELVSTQSDQMVDTATVSCMKERNEKQGSNSVSTLDTDEMNAPVSSTDDHDDISPLHKEMDFDIEAQLKKLRHFQFPHTDGQNRRRFQLTWLNRFQWIEYSTIQDAAYCNTCRQFGSKSLAARYVFSGKARESLLFFETTENQDAKAFTDLTLKSLSSYELDAMRILSQCYDGASVMNGYKSGVAKRLQDALKKIIPYVHCFNHRLHLVIIALVKSIPEMREFFDELQLIYTTLRKPKIKKIHDGTSMKRLIETRWTGHNNAAKCMLSDFASFVETFKLAEKNTSKEIDGEDVAVCIGLLAVITRKKFAFILIVINEILSVLEPADTIFQKRETGYKRAMPVIEAVKSSIMEYRTEEQLKKFDELADDLLKISTPTSSRLTRQNRARSSRLKDFVVTETLGEGTEEPLELKSIYFQIIDVIVTELNARFSENDEILVALSEAHNMNITDLQPLQKLEIQLPSEAELKVAKKYVDKKRSDHDKMHAERVKKGEDEKDLPRFNVLRTVYEAREAFPEVYRLFATIETFACSTAICECSFSSLSLVDTPKRFSMKNERLRNLAFLGFEKKKLKNVDLDFVLQEFNRKKDRKVQLF